MPLVFWGDTSELFELNKIWVTYILTIIILTAWIARMVFGKRMYIQRTPLDIPILLFLSSQVLSTIFSLDQHISFWGYYSRFNGGLLSTITYIFLYYAYVSHITKRQTIRILQGTLVSSLIIGLWGLPAHFGYDPTCLVFRGTLDVSCWTEAFQPKVRIFSTLGQPDWLAAHFAALIPIALAFFLSYRSKYRWFAGIFYFGLIVLMYVDVLYTRARSGFIALAVGLGIFFFGYILMQDSQKKQSSLQTLRLPILTLGVMLIFTFFLGTPLQQLDTFTYQGLISHFNKPSPTAPSPKSAPPQVKKSAVSTGEFGGTDSGKIRLFVWQGALEAWKHNPLFGTGVETFAFAYYRYRPVGHNLTSEWDFLYNKAHNEYLNYLTTTGLFGLGTYLFMIAYFLFLAMRSFQKAYAPTYENNKKNHLSYQPSKDHRLVVLGILAGYVSILVSNFFGFSVVTVNMFLFVLPACVLLFEDLLRDDQILAYPASSSDVKLSHTTVWQYFITSITCLISLYLIVSLGKAWQADRKYAYGTNLTHAGYYQNANQPLRDAITIREDEPVFKDELATDDAILAENYVKQNDATSAAKLAQEAITLSNQLTEDNPNNIVFWKSRVRIYYSLGRIDPKYMPVALESIKKAHELAPTDAKIMYNLGLIYGQSSHVDEAINTLEQTVKLKKDYKDAYYALGLIYHEKALDSQGVIAHPEYQKKAEDTMHFILDNFDSKDTAAQNSLKAWKTP